MTPADLAAIRERDSEAHDEDVYIFWGYEKAQVEGEKAMTDRHTLLDRIERLEEVLDAVGLLLSNGGDYSDLGVGDTAEVLAIDYNHLAAKVAALNPTADGSKP